MQEALKSIRWCAVFALWALGAFILRQLWNFQKSLPDPFGSYIEFTIMFLATFYFLILFPIKHCIDWLLRRCISKTVDQRLESCL